MFLGNEEANEALRIIRQLSDAGFVAYLAGGCVRDALLQKRPKDFDVATNATPESVRAVFGRNRTLAFGASFGVIGVLPERDREITTAGMEKSQQSCQPTEVATFRSDGVYSDGRRPDTVHFGEAEQDALRRDFTINGLFYDPQQRRIIDYVGGRDDIVGGLLRTIGDAASRIEEDKLRMLRAVRFATTLRFKLHDDTVAAIRDHADEIHAVSGERIGAEMRRVLTSPHAASGLRLLMSLGLHRGVLPELAFVDWERYESIVGQLADRHLATSLACMLMALERPADRVDAVASRWKLSNEERRQTRVAIARWTIVRDARSLPWSAVQPTLVHRDAATIVELSAAIIAADQSDSRGIDLAREALRWPPEKLDPPPLLSGDDLRAQGIPAGPIYQSILQTIRDAQLNGEITSREQAIATLPSHP